MCKGRYDSPHIAKELQMQGVTVSPNLVAKIMKKKNLKSVRVRFRGFKKTINSKHTYLILENRLAQNFHVRDKNEALVSDITYIKTGEQWLRASSKL